MNILCQIIIEAQKGFSLWQFISANINAINAIVLFLTLIVIIFYTLETRAMRKSSERNIILLENQNNRVVLRENKEKEVTQNFILSQIEVIIDATDIQIIEINSFLEKLKLSQIRNLEFKITADFTTKRIRVISSPHIYELFVQDRESKLISFNLLLRQLDLIDGLINGFITSFNYILEYFKKYEAKWNDNMVNIGNLHDKWLTNFGINGFNPRSDPFLNQMIDLYHNWADIDNHLDMYVAEEFLINPLLEQARTLQPNPYANAMLEPLLGSLDAVQNIKNLKEIKVKEFEGYITQIDGIKSELQKVKENFINE